MKRFGKYGFRHAAGRIAALILAVAAAVQATGFLTLDSSPSGAEIWYTGPDDPDMKYLGDTPLENRELAVGKYNFWLILSSHDTLFIPEVFIAEGQVTQMNREIPTHYGFLEVETKPDSAEIWLDGVRIGPSPYVNNLVLPGRSKLKVVPREAHFKNSSRSLSIGKGDSVRLDISAPYRDKSFLRENLSLPAWRFQFETGLQFRSSTGNYDSAGKKMKFSSDSLPSQWDYPLRVRLGLPQGFEIHLLVPYKSAHTPEDNDQDLAVFPSNMLLGAKYSYRPLNIGMDVSYGVGFKNSGDALNHDYLALTLIAAASKDRFLGEAQAGFEFHFTEKGNNKVDPGDQGFAHAQVGYLVDPLQPYLGLTLRVHLDGDMDGKTDKLGGYMVIPEPGLILDIADLLSLQFGVPFTVAGSNSLSFWGIHLSLSIGLGIL
jgi:hypothetical protein